MENIIENLLEVMDEVNEKMENEIDGAMVNYYQVDKINFEDNMLFRININVNNRKVNWFINSKALSKKGEYVELFIEHSAKNLDEFLNSKKMISDDLFRPFGTIFIDEQYMDLSKNNMILTIEDAYKLYADIKNSDFCIEYENFKNGFEKNILIFSGKEYLDTTDMLFKILF